MIMRVSLTPNKALLTVVRLQEGKTYDQKRRFQQLQLHDSEEHALVGGER